MIQRARGAALPAENGAGFRYRWKSGQENSNVAIEPQIFGT
jgi:hypothetical protein